MDENNYNNQDPLLEVVPSKGETSSSKKTRINTKNKVILGVTLTVLFMIGLLVLYIMLIQDETIWQRNSSPKNVTKSVNIFEDWTQQHYKNKKNLTTVVPQKEKMSKNIMEIKQNSTSKPTPLEFNYEELTKQLYNIKENIVTVLHNFFSNGKGTLNHAKIGKGKEENIDAVLRKLSESRLAINNEKKKGGNQQIIQKIIEIINGLEEVGTQMKTLSSKTERSLKMEKSEYEKFLRLEEDLEYVITIELPVVEETLY